MDPGLAPRAICACSGCTALSARARTPIYSCRLSAHSIFPGAVVKHSSTARPTLSYASAATCSSAVSIETTCRPPGTGSSNAPTSSGARRNATGSPKLKPTQPRSHRALAGRLVLASDRYPRRAHTNAAACRRGGSPKALTHRYPDNPTRSRCSLRRVGVAVALGSPYRSNPEVGGASTRLMRSWLRPEGERGATRSVGLLSSSPRA